MRIKVFAGGMGFVVLLGVILTISGGTAFADRAMHQTSDVHRFDNGSVVGEAALKRTDSGVSMTIKSSVEGELLDFGSQTFTGEFFTQGDATTNWWVVFNKPDMCTGPCGEDEVFNALDPATDDPVMVDVIFATGHVAGSKWRGAAHLREGDTSGSFFDVGLMDARKAEIHLVVRSHGPAENLTPGELDDAISSVDGGCGINTCGDAQFAVFMPPMP